MRWVRTYVLGTGSKLHFSMPLQVIILMDAHLSEREDCKSWIHFRPIRRKESWTTSATPSIVLYIVSEFHHPAAVLPPFRIFILLIAFRNIKRIRNYMMSRIKLFEFLYDFSKEDLWSPITRYGGRHTRFATRIAVLIWYLKWSYYYEPAVTNLLCLYHDTLNSLSVKLLQRPWGNYQVKI